jgi:sulfatase modifying factor 1
MSDTVVESELKHTKMYQNVSSGKEINPALEIEDEPDNVPAGMVYVPGGTTTFGSESGNAYEKPLVRMEMKPFFMDEKLVSVGEFRKFAEETGYVTFSEKMGDGIIFDFERGEWAIVPGVTWEYPLGPNQDKADEDHPVTLLTIEDAEAYLDWVGKRLPTEFEWEHAARGITDRDNRYAWGDELIVDGKFMSNTWNGIFPSYNNSDDGYLMTAPVGIYGKNDLGITDMGGNVWEWTSSWFRPYAEIQDDYVPNPDSKKTLKGGSFMCHDSYCHGFRVSARSSTPPDNNMFHIGFRGVISAN